MRQPPKNWVTVRIHFFDSARNPAKTVSVVFPPNLPNN